MVLFSGSASPVISQMLYMNIMLLDKIYIEAVVNLVKTKYQEVKVTVGK